jgi:large subunit ribosomal protein L4
MYDIAWRTALSYRYRKGQLVIVNTLLMEPSVLWLQEILERLKMGGDHGKSLFIKAELRDKDKLLGSLMKNSSLGVYREMRDVDVKDLLKQGRVVVEKEALDWLLGTHQSDLSHTRWKMPS